MSGEEEAETAEALPLADSAAAAEERPAAVKETVLKKRRKDEQWAAVRRERQDIAKSSRARSAGEGTFKRAEQFVKEFRQQERDFLRLLRASKKLKAAPYQVEFENRPLFVIRIRGTTDMHPQSRKILHSLRLRQIFYGVFLRPSSGVMSMLKKIERYVTYGYPDLNTVSDLIYKRGHAKVNNARTSLTDNSIVEQALGQHGIICIPDLIHHIFNVGSHFNRAAAFLWPFKLRPPPSIGGKLGTHFVEAGDAGNREDRINDLVHQMN